MSKIESEIKSLIKIGLEELTAKYIVYSKYGLDIQLEEVIEMIQEEQKFIHNELKDLGLLKGATPKIKSCNIEEQDDNGNKNI